jgi:hypothetical protein
MGGTPFGDMRRIQLPVHIGGSTSEAPAAPAPSGPSCSTCGEFRRLLHTAVQTIRQQHSRFRALESSLDAQVHAALRELQILEYICRECIELDKGLTDREVTDLARRLLVSGLYFDHSLDQRRPAAAAADLDSAADLCIQGFSYGSPMRVIPDVTTRAPSADSECSDLYDDLPVDDDAPMSLDSSSASD